MNLLHLIPSMDPRKGGPSQGVRSLTPRMASRGHAVEVASLDDPGEEYPQVEGAARVHALGAGRGAIGYNAKLAPWLRENARRFDVILLNGLWQYAGSALSKERADGPPYFVFPHGMLDPWFQKAPERRLKALRNIIYWHLVEKKVIERAAGLLFTCEEEMRLARTTFAGYRPKREVVVGFGIEQPPAYSERMRAALESRCPGIFDRPYLLFLGRIDKKKGIDVLIEAYGRILTGSRSPKLIIAGPGTESAHGAELQTLAKRVCPAGSVIWPGMLTGDAKWGAIHLAEAFVLSSHQENFGIAVVEALACGVPVLITNKINIHSEIQQRGAGMASNDTPEAFATILRNWNALSQSSREQMKDAAVSCYSKSFTVDVAAQNILSAVSIENMTAAVEV